MKTIRAILMVVLTASLASTAPGIVRADGPKPQRQVRAAETDKEVVTGTVKEKQGTQLTVQTKHAETKVTLTDKTTYKKQGKPATAEDIAVGARVLVQASKNDGGELEAVEITILGAERPS